MLDCSLKELAQAARQAAASDLKYEQGDGHFQLLSDLAEAVELLSSVAVRACEIAVLNAPILPWEPGESDDATVRATVEAALKEALAERNEPCSTTTPSS